MTAKQKYHHLRKIETYERYRRHMAEKPHGEECGLCRLAQEPIAEYKHWVIVENEFPYDRVTEIHHMLIPRRHVNEKELSEEELGEFKTIKQSMDTGKYQHILESLVGTLSIPDHYHVHLVRWNSEE